jgi:hypothetical protein
MDVLCASAREYAMRIGDIERRMGAGRTAASELVGRVRRDERRSLSEKRRRVFETTRDAGGGGWESGETAGDETTGDDGPTDDERAATQIMSVASMRPQTRSPSSVMP